MGAPSSEKSLGQGRRDETTLRAVRRWWIVVIFGVALYVVLDVIAQSLPPHYSPISQAESDLAVGPYGYIMTINFVNRGLFSLVFLYAFARTLDLEGLSRKPFRNGSISWAVWAVGALLLAAFPTDVPNLPLSWHGAIHLVVALFAFVGGAVGAYLLSLHLEEGGLLRGAKPFALPLSLIVLILLVVELAGGIAVPRVSARIGGLTERLFLAGVLLWMVLVSVHMARVLGKESRLSGGETSATA